MLEKILLISLVLISFIQAHSERLESKYLKEKEELVLEKGQNFLVCVEINEDLPKNDSFYILIACEEKGKKMNKKFPYRFLDSSCKDEVLEVDSNNLEIQFTYIKDSIKTDKEDNGFYYEYEFTKKEDNQKFMRMLIQNFDGNKMTLVYSKIAASTLIIIIVVSVVVGVFIIAAIVIIIICCICHKKKVADIQQQYQTSFVNDNNDNIIPRDSNID